MKNFLRLAAILMLVVPVAASCGGGGGGTRGPDRQEGRVEEAKLREFIPFFPAAPAGYTRGEEPGMYSGSDGSTISYTYTNGTKMFMVILTFSTKNTGETESMMKDESMRTMFGFNMGTAAGRDALVAKQRGAGRSDYTVVVSNSRMVAIAPASSDLPRSGDRQTGVRVDRLQRDRQQVGRQSFPLGHGRGEPGHGALFPGATPERAPFTRQPCLPKMTGWVAVERSE